ncbi:MAG: FecR domain-containing protein, partial [Elusimicrobia bacterium]|nr:FecR domain-containing protein [Elusimicrobiota bacterium]
MMSHRRAAAGFLAVVLCALPAAAWAGASLTKISGLVELKRASSDRWDPITSLPQSLSAGDSVRTGARATATLTFDDGSKVELGSSASFTLEEASAARSALKLGFGALKAFVHKLASRQFQVRTPTAVCSVRGTEFRVEVLRDGRTIVDLYKGLLGVEDHKGQQVLLHPDERVQIGLGGLGEPGRLPSQASEDRRRFHALMQREMALDLSKEQVLTAAIEEVKTADFEQGKSLIDAFGHRVRVEEYIVRPQADQFKLVVLDQRQSRFDYFYYLGQFNQALPTDLTIALRQLGGSVDSAPDYWLTSYQTGRSNTVDSVVELAQGGHPVDVSHNGVAQDAVGSFFDPTLDKYVDVSGRKVYQTLFDDYGFYVEGKLKYGWTGNNLQSYTKITAATTNDPITGALLPQALPARSVSTTFPDAGFIHQVVYESYSDGTFTRWDNFLIDDQGRVATAA